MKFRPIALALSLALSTGGCDVLELLIPAEDATPPSAVWLQADIPDQPLANVVLDGTAATAEMGELDQVVVTAHADDPDGGLSGLRIWSSTTRRKPGTIEGPSLAGAPEVEFVSTATVGELGDASADVSYTFDVEPLIGSFQDVYVDLWAEAENFHGGISETPILTLHVQRIGLRLHVVALSNDDGSQATDVTADQFSDVVDRANVVFRGTGMTLDYDPATDFETLADTSMNLDQTLFSDGNTMADAHPGEILVLLRFGSGTSPTGNGNAYPPPGAGPKPSSVNDADQRYIALPNQYPEGELSFLTLGNGSFVAHEFGHYLGLYHTFHGWDGVNPVHGTATTGAAADQAIADYIAAHGGTIDALDGDLLADTAPDPGVIAYQAQGLDPCASPQITISGYTFAPPITNVMSYYGLCTTGADPAPNGFSADQIARMQHTLTVPARSHLVVP